MQTQYFHQILRRTLRVRILFFSILFLQAAGTIAQQPVAAQAAKPYKYVIKGGHVIDPKNNIDGIMDIAISAPSSTTARDGKIALVAKNINPNLGLQVIDATGLYVTPGLVDIHVHLFWGHEGSQYKNGPNGLPGDGFTFRAGVTTVVDAGSSGWRDFETFKKQTIDASQTRVLAMLNIVGTGMAGRSETNIGENNIDEMDPKKAAEMALKYPNDIVGIKLAHYNGHNWTPTDRGIEAGKLANIPFMVDFGAATPVLSLDSLLNIKFRPGDILTHAFGGNGNNNPNGRESVVDVTTNKVKPYVFTAQKRGIIFDVGFGATSFFLNQANYAFKNGFIPNSISTDLHTNSMNNAAKDMPNIMSMFMAIGMTLPDVIKASTWNPAQEIKRPELGNLSVGSIADVAIFTLRTGKFGFFARDAKIAGTKRLETEMTIRGGNVVYNLNARIEPLNPPQGAR